MAKTNGVEHRRREQLRITGRDRLVPRVPRRNQEPLPSVSGDTGADVRRRKDRGRKAKAPRLPHGGCADNWRVETDDGEVIAIEPGREHEHVFSEHADDFQAALEFAAAQLRKAMAG